MKTGLGKGALFGSFTLLGCLLLVGCKTPPYCDPLGACGGDFFGGAVPATDIWKQDGLVDREWVIVGQRSEEEGVTNAFCQDQLQTPPAPLSLLRQPPVPANDRPPDKVTADWCYNIVFKPTGEINR